MQNLDSFTYRKHFSDFYMENLFVCLFVCLFAAALYLCQMVQKSSLTSEVYNHNENIMKVEMKSCIWIKRFDDRKCSLKAQFIRNFRRTGCVDTQFLATVEES